MLAEFLWQSCPGIAFRCLTHVLSFTTTGLPVGRLQRTSRHQSDVFYKQQNFKMWTILVNDMVFTSPTVDYPPVLPWDAGDGAIYEPEMPKDLKKPLWAVSCYPQIAYCAWDVPFHGPILKRLQMSYHTVPVQKSLNQWSLAPAIVASWMSLENALIWVSNFLLTKSPVANEGVFPLDFKIFTAPSRFGYYKTYDVQEKCRRSVMRSRDAFVPLMALCTMAIATWSKLPETATDTTVETCLRWAVALRNQNVDVDWIADLMASPIADVSGATKRVGTLIRADGPNLWWNHLPSMIRTHVPVWILWGTISIPRNTPHCPPAMLTLKPNRLDIENAIRFQNQIFEGTANPHPPVQGGSGQIQGETWRDMLSRRDQEKQRERERREGSDAAGHSQKPEISAPEHNSDAVFEWIEVEDRRYRGKLIRCRVPRWHVSEIWDRYDENQRRYDEFWKEWDLCKEFGREETDDLVYNAPEDEMLEYLAPVASSAAPAPSALSCSDVARQAYAGHKPDAHTYPLYGQILRPLQMLRLWYGFLSPPHDSYLVQYQPVMGQTKLEKILGFPPGSLPTQLLGSLSDFVNALIRSSLGHLSTLCDIHSQEKPLINSTTIRFDISNRVHADGRQEQVYRVWVEGFPQQSKSWDLVLVNPTAVLCLLRLEGNRSVESILQDLVTFGIPCSTVGLSGDTDRSLCQYPYPGAQRVMTLGWVKKGHQFTYSNYRHYEYTRDMLLQRRYGRAALLSGGIVWRLARELLGVDCVLAGPSVDVYRYGSWFEYDWAGIGGDDVLSEEEEDVVCGLYKVYTGDFLFIRCGAHLFTSTIFRRNGKTD